jgi:hypothetical protein
MTRVSPCPISLRAEHPVILMSQNEQVDTAVALKTRIREMPLSIVDWATGYSDLSFRDFPQFFQVNSGGQCFD